MPSVEIAGTTIFHEVVGEGPPLLVCHGGPGFHHGPYRSLDPLATSRRVVYWDHRGHGRSGRPPRSTLSMAQWADDTADLAAHLGIDRATVFGHSYGGWVAQELAIRRPDVVAALVLAGTTPGQLGTGESESDHQGPPPPQEVVDLLSTPPSSDAELADVYRHLAPHYTRSADPSILTDHAEESLIHAATMIAVFEELAGWSSVDRLRDIACPTLVVAGRHDVFCSHPQAERIASRIPGADLMVFGESGHFMWLEQPEVFFATVGSWIDTHATGSGSSRDTPSGAGHG